MKEALPAPDSEDSPSAGLNRRDFARVLSIGTPALMVEVGNMISPRRLLAQIFSEAPNAAPESSLVKDIVGVLRDRRKLDALLEVFGNTQDQKRYDGLSASFQEWLTVKEKEYPYRDTWEEINRPVYSNYKGGTSPTFLQAAGLPPIAIRIFERYTERKTREGLLGSMIEAVGPGERQKVAQEVVSAYLNTDPLIVRMALRFASPDDEFIMRNVLMKVDPQNKGSMETVVPQAFEALQNKEPALAMLTDPEILAAVSHLHLMAQASGEERGRREQEAKKSQTKNFLLEIAVNPNGDSELPPEIEDHLWDLLEIDDPINLYRRIVYLEDKSLIVKYDTQLRRESNGNYAHLYHLGVWLEGDPDFLAKYRKELKEEDLEEMKKDIDKDTKTRDAIFGTVGIIGQTFSLNLLKELNPKTDINFLKQLVLAHTESHAYGLGQHAVHLLTDYVDRMNRGESWAGMEWKRKLDRGEINKEEYDRIDQAARKAFNFSIVRDIEQGVGVNFFLGLLREIDLENDNARLYAAVLRFLSSYIELYETGERSEGFLEVYDAIYIELEKLSKAELQMIVDGKISFTGAYKGVFDRHHDTPVRFPEFATRFAREKLGLEVE